MSPVHFGPAVIGDQAYEEEKAEAESGRDVFGPAVLDPDFHLKTPEERHEAVHPKAGPPTVEEMEAQIEAEAEELDAEAQLDEIVAVEEVGDEREERGELYGLPVPIAAQMIEESTDEAQLSEWLQDEYDSKNRKGVIEAILARLDVIAPLEEQTDGDGSESD